MSPTDLTKKRKNETMYPNIFLRENDKLNYLSTLLSSTELIGNRSVNHRKVVIPKSRYEYRPTTIRKDDLLRMESAKFLLQKITCCDGKQNKPRSCTKLKNPKIGITVETAGGKSP